MYMYIKIYTYLCANVAMECRTSSFTAASARGPSRTQGSDFYCRGPADHINISILHSDPKAQAKMRVGSRNHGV